MAEILEKIICFHCGDDCNDTVIQHEEKSFCCNGCKLVYEILNENNLCAYYDLNKTPGIKQSNVISERFKFLEDDTVRDKLISFKKGDEVRITFKIPSMHCSSCIWLLENFKKIDKGVLSSQVNFLKKELYIIYDERKTSLCKIVEQLALTGYEPSLQLEAIEKKEKKKISRSRITRIGIAGFCFGNIMMLSFPEYFSSGKNIDPQLRSFFSILNLLLALPVFFYSASEFFIRSWQAIKHKSASIDIPIAIGIAAIFLKSFYEIITQTGSGYFDSGSGLVFFMLIGRWFQDYTFDSLSFDRDYKSYFPIAVTTIKNGIEKTVIVNDLKVNDRILIRNNEIIPVDAILLKGSAQIDYRFVTGESELISHHSGATIYAGGKHFGNLIELQVTKEISQSYLTQLWNKNFSKHSISNFEKIVQLISKWFIAATFLIAFLAGAYWWTIDVNRAINAFTAVLVIACPCALALSAPFTYGNILRILGKNKIFLRDYRTLEKLADIDTIVFDKTGTLTNNFSDVDFIGQQLSNEEKKIIYSLTRESTHPLSKGINELLKGSGIYSVTDFTEQPGKGIAAVVNGVKVKAGNHTFVLDMVLPDEKRTNVLISLNEKFRGTFVFNNSYRTGIRELASDLFQKNYSFQVLTGDNDSDRNRLNYIFSGNAQLKFNQSPHDKLFVIKDLREKNKKVLMIGDGLNDSGALMQSDVGISLTENTNSFTPSSDIIADAENLVKLPELLSYSKFAVRIIIISFILSLFYNFIGLSFAVTGTLSPLIAAILMPISTISLVLFTVVSGSVKGKFLGFK